jgi:hypothetical protein
VGNAARDEDIRPHAYEIYLERGKEPGRELDDWLHAERELEGGVFPHAHRELGSESWTSVDKRRRSHILGVAALFVGVFGGVVTLVQRHVVPTQQTATGG